MPEDDNQNKADLNKVKSIIDTLRKYPDGVWLRKLSRESSIPLSTVHYYINNVIDSFVVSRGARDDEGRFFGLRLIQLRKGVKKQLESGKSIAYLIKTKDILTGN